MAETWPILILETQEFSWHCMRVSDSFSVSWCYRQRWEESRFPKGQSAGTHPSDLSHFLATEFEFEPRLRRFWKMKKPEFDFLLKSISEQRWSFEQCCKYIQHLPLKPRSDSIKNFRHFRIKQFSQKLWWQLHDLLFYTENFIGPIPRPKFHRVTLLYRVILCKVVQLIGITLTQDDCSRCRGRPKCQKY